MPGARPLTPSEERKLARLARRLSPRDYCLISAQAWTGFRIAEILRWTVAHVVDANGNIRDQVGLRPGMLKGKFGNTRWIPISRELHRALERHLAFRRRAGPLAAHDPLFLSREHQIDGSPKALGTSSAEKIIRRRLRQIAEGDTQRLSTHTLRKTWARRLYVSSNKDLLIVRDGLGHSSVSVTQVYLSGDRTKLDDCIRAGDWTRRPRATRERLRSLTPAAPDPLPMAMPPTTTPCAAPGEWLPGFAPAA